MINPEASNCPDPARPEIEGSVAGRFEGALAAIGFEYDLGINRCDVVLDVVLGSGESQARDSTRCNLSSNRTAQELQQKPLLGESLAPSSTLYS